MLENIASEAFDCTSYQSVGCCCPRKLNKGAFNIKYISLESPSPITFLYLPIGVLFVFEYDEDSIWCSFEFFLETVIKVQLVLAFF